MSIKTGTGVDTGHYPRILNVPPEYNLLGNIGKEPQTRGISNDAHKKGAHVEFRLQSNTAEHQTNEDNYKINKTSSNTDANQNSESSPVPIVNKEQAVVHWADNINGQDIRIELKFGDCLGQGSFAKVYEGFDKRLKIPVAIKVIDKRKIKDSETKKKALIEEEIYILSRMDHPNISKYIRLIEDVKRVACKLPDFYCNGALWIQYS